MGTPIYSESKELKKSEKNLIVIQNFILHVTHCGDHGKDANYDTIMHFTPEELYKYADDYITEDHVDGVDGDED